MQAPSVSVPRRVRDIASCREWLDGLGAASHDRLDEFTELLADLAQSALEPDRVLAIVEQLRPAHLAQVAGVLARANPDEFPMKSAHRRGCARALASLEQGRDLYERLHELLRAPGDPSTEIDTRTLDQGDDAATTITAVSRTPGGAAPQARRGPRTVTAPPAGMAIPLGRAIDYHARRLVAMQHLKIAVAQEDWDAHCVLARRMRAAGLLDIRLPDEAPLLRAPTARALFVYPLLVFLAQPNTRSAAQAALIERLARRWAGRVGFRLEQGAILQDARNGPSVELTALHTVRLVSHRLAARIAARQAELEAIGARAGKRLPRGLTLSATRAILGSLRACWCEPRPHYQVPDVRLGVMLLRFGFPAGADDDGSGRTGRARSRLHAGPARSYIYGRFEGDTLTRASGNVPEADPLASWIEAAEAADWVSIERHQSVFEGSFAGGGMALGAIAMIVPVSRRDEKRVAVSGKARGAGAGPGYMLGRVVALAQQPGSGPEAPTAHRVSVAVWSGRPLLVGVRVGEGEYRDAFLISPDASLGESESLLVRAGAMRPGDRCTLREGARDCALRVDEVLEQGPGYERVRITRSEH